jgi:hypothetical protein
VTVTVGDRTFTFSGRVIYVESGMGFSMKFAGVPEADATELTRRLAEMKKK